MNVLQCIYINHQYTYSHCLSDIGQCDVWNMADSQSRVVNGTTCGVMLSPQFPGLVEPNRWTWRVKSEPNLYYALNVFYVVGPGIENQCRDFFQSKLSIVFIMYYLNILLPLVAYRPWIFHF